MANWTLEAGAEALDRFCAEADELESSLPNSAEHIRWVVTVTRFLGEVFGEASVYLYGFTKISWVYQGPMAVHVGEVFVPGATEGSYNNYAFREALDTARGLLLSPKDELLAESVDE